MTPTDSVCAFDAIQGASPASRSAALPHSLCSFVQLALTLDRIYVAQDKRIAKTSTENAVGGVFRRFLSSGTENHP